MVKKLLGGAHAAVTLAGNAVKHAAWFVNHQLGDAPRDRHEDEDEQ